MIYKRLAFNKILWQILLIVFVVYLTPKISYSQVILRDTIITWQHHRFELNADGSMKDYTTSDSDIEQETFLGAKVIENDFIRLVVLPEYGARVLSFYYKPTAHEYLYQSEVGSPYGIGDGNFYFDWLMVYGGIFPTFPEPEHGKTWFLPWKYSIIKDSPDTVTIRMEFQDSTSYSGAPGGFNNGITNITCQVDISVYRNSTLWDYDVTLINNEATNVNYEYWTCTTLTPGSEPENTAAPLNTEIIVPVDEYFAGWSPGGWIGSYNSRYNMSDIDYLDKWQDMGIAYAYNLDNIYWGVINHDNNEGIFRISENIETKGMKMWTWGRNNIGNDLYDFSNGGADNYIELWAGVSNSFFSDAVIAANEEKSWTESYCATTNMNSISNINNEATVNLVWDESNMNLSYELNTFYADRNYTLEMFLEGSSIHEIVNKSVSFSPTGIIEMFSLVDYGLSIGEYRVNFILYDQLQNPILEANKMITVSIITGISSLLNKDNTMVVRSNGDNNISIELSEFDIYFVKVLGVNGQVIMEKNFSDKTTKLTVPGNGLYIIYVQGSNSIHSDKVLIR